MKTQFIEKMSIFGGPEDKGVGEQESLALIEPADLHQWWFRYLFTDNTGVGLARRLNPDAFYCACDGITRTCRVMFFVTAS
jgi:hypothetical protein